MSQKWNRREFQVALGVCASLAPVKLSKSFEASPQGELQGSGIVRATRGSVKLIAPPDVARGEVWRYGLTYPFQVAPRTAAVYCNIRRVNNPGVDFEVGTDVVLFNDLSNFKPLSIAPVSRNHEEPNPNSNIPNEKSIMVKYPVAGSFVPWQAKRTDGTAHPHAGTGFGITSAIAWPLDDRDVNFSSDRVGRRQFIGKQSYGYLELQQYSFDGKTFRVTSQQKVFRTENIGGWNLMERPIRNGIPDGDDLLLAFSAKENQREEREGNSSWRCGVSHWRRENGNWKCVAFSPVTEYGEAFEPSLIRDLDGSLLFTARGLTEQNRCNIRVWKSTDRGASWKLTLEALGPFRCLPSRSIRLPTEHPLSVPTSMRFRSFRSETSVTTTPDTTQKIRAPEGSGWAVGCGKSLSSGPFRRIERVWNLPSSCEIAGKSLDLLRVGAVGMPIIPHRWFFNWPTAIGTTSSGIESWKERRRRMPSRRQPTVERLSKR